MSEWVSPSFDHLKTVVKASQGTLILCSPYVSKPGLDAVCDSLPSSVEAVEVWTKRSERDWFTGASDPPALAKFLQRVKEQVRSIQIRCSNELHAKIIISDGSMALAGSANLTNGGFKQNKEIARIVNGEEIEQLRDIVRETRKNLSLLNEDEFQSFVSCCESSRDKRKRILDKLSASTLDESWIPLSKFHDTAEMKLRPSKIRFTDGSESEQELKYWYEVLVKTTKWLIGSHGLRADSCPIKTKGGGLIVNRVRKYENGSEITNPYQLEKGLLINNYRLEEAFFINKNLGNTDLLR